MTRGDRLLQMYVVLAVAAAGILAAIGTSEAVAKRHALGWLLAAGWVFWSAVLLVVLVDFIWPLFPLLARLRSRIHGQVKEV